MSKGATPQDTEMMVFGSGFTQYPYWGAIRQKFVYPAPDDWEWEIEYWDGEDESWKWESITHAVVMRAVRDTARGFAIGVSDRLIEQCRYVRFDAEEVDLDADEVDTLMQIAVYGTIVY